MSITRDEAIERCMGLIAAIPTDLNDTHPETLMPWVQQVHLLIGVELAAAEKRGREEATETLLRRGAIHGEGK